MNLEPSLPIDARLAGQFLSFQSRRGLWRLRLQLLWRGLRWRWSVDGARWMKRALDVVASSCALLALAPLFAVIALCIKLEDRGPVFFGQTRVGRHGREFRIYKFRSMHRDAEQRLKDLLAKNQHDGGVTFKIKNDPRVTRVGRILRKYSLDELPQFYNVLRGDMSLVGPRPPIPREVQLYTLSDRRRLMVEPGITCIWQISGRAEIDFPGQVQLDVSYIESRSLGKDINILVRTVPAVLFGPGAY